MFKLLFRFICLSVIAILAFFVLSLWSGGDKIRWFGKKVEEKTEYLGKTADRIKETKDKTVEGVDRTKRKIKSLLGKDIDEEDKTFSSSDKEKD